MRLVMKTLQDQSRGEYEYSPTAAYYSRSFIIDVFDAHFFDGRGVYGLRGEAEPCSHANRRAISTFTG